MTPTTIEPIISPDPKAINIVSFKSDEEEDGPVAMLAKLLQQ